MESPARARKKPRTTSTEGTSKKTTPTSPSRSRSRTKWHSSTVAADLVGKTFLVPARVYPKEKPPKGNQGWPAKVVTHDYELKDHVIIKFPEYSEKFYFPASEVRTWEELPDIDGPSPTKKRVRIDTNTTIDDDNSNEAGPSTTPAATTRGGSVKKRVRFNLTDKADDDLRMELSEEEDDDDDGDDDFVLQLVSDSEQEDDKEEEEEERVVVPSGAARKRKSPIKPPKSALKKHSTIVEKKKINGEESKQTPTSTDRVLPAEHSRQALLRSQAARARQKSKMAMKKPPFRPTLARKAARAQPTAAEQSPPQENTTATLRSKVVAMGAAAAVGGAAAFMAF